MSIERSGRYEPTANVRWMKWSEDNVGERKDGIRVAYGNSFCWIPEEQGIILANALVDYLEANGLAGGGGNNA